MSISAWRQNDPTLILNVRGQYLSGFCKEYNKRTSGLYKVGDFMSYILRLLDVATSYRGMSVLSTSTTEVLAVGVRRTRSTSIPGIIRSVIASAISGPLVVCVASIVVIVVSWLVFLFDLI